MDDLSKQNLQELKQERHGAPPYSACVLRRSTIYSTSVSSISRPHASRTFRPATVATSLAFCIAYSRHCFFSSLVSFPSAECSLNRLTRSWYACVTPISRASTASRLAWLSSTLPRKILKAHANSAVTTLLRPATSHCSQSGMKVVPGSTVVAV